MDLSLAQFKYRNHKDEVETRLVLPVKIWFGSTAFHPEPQWLLQAFDILRNETRDFALAGFLSEWKLFQTKGTCFWRLIVDGEEVKNPQGEYTLQYNDWQQLTLYHRDQRVTKCWQIHLMFDSPEES